MAGHCRQLAWLMVLVQAASANAASAASYLKKNDFPWARAIPLEKIDERYRELVRQVLEKPILAGRGPAETFNCRPEQYTWFMDHPDRAVVAWRRLGAKCVSIYPRGDGKFSWADENGSEVIWQTVYNESSVRIWFAEGKVRPGPLLPLVPVKAVVVLRHHNSRAADGAAVMQHQSDLFVHTDSKTAAMMARMLGPTANRAVEHGMGQLQLFFSGLSWYLDRHPEQAETLLKAGE
jgi:hypothetical protein